MPIDDSTSPGFAKRSRIPDVPAIPPDPSPEAGSAETLPSATVMISTKDQPGDLEQAVTTLLGQTVIPAELVIVDQSPGIESRERIRKLLARTPPPLRNRIRLFYLRNTRIPGPGAALNRAMELASGAIWLFLDDNVVLEADSVEQLLRTYRLHPEVDGVSGVVTNLRRPSWPFRCWRRLFALGPFNDGLQPFYWHAGSLRHRRRPIHVRYFGSGLMSFRANRIGHQRFDETLRGASCGYVTDFCAGLGPGIRLAVAPAARLARAGCPVVDSLDERICSEVSGGTYLYGRKWRTGVRNRLCFAWFMAGYLGLASLRAIVRLSAEPLRAFFVGVRGANWRATSWRVSDQSFNLPLALPSLPLIPVSRWNLARRR